MPDNDPFQEIVARHRCPPVAASSRRESAPLDAVVMARLYDTALTLVAVVGNAAAAAEVALKRQRNLLDRRVHFSEGEHRAVQRIPIDF
jgi:hypothetical protein